MDGSLYAALSPSNEGVNPLRPYYRAPSLIPPPLPNSTTPQAPGLRVSLGNSARDMLAELNYGELLGSGDGAAPSAVAAVKLLLDRAMWRYSSVFMAQPFEVAKTILQCHDADATATAAAATAAIRRIKRERQRQRQRSQMSRGRSGSRQHYSIAEEDESASDAASAALRTSSYSGSSDDNDDDDDAPSYFTSTAPRSSTRSRNRHSSVASRSTSDAYASTRASRSRHHHPHPHPYARPRNPHLTLTSPSSLLAVLAQTWAREGAFGLCKGTNATFAYGVLLRTLEVWARGALAALLGLPDTGVVLARGGAGAATASVAALGPATLDVADCARPLASLAVAVVAAAVVGVLLAPLDIARTRCASSFLFPPSLPPFLRPLKGCPC